MSFNRRSASNMESFIPSGQPNNYNQFLDFQEINTSFTPYFTNPPNNPMLEIPSNGASIPQMGQPSFAMGQIGLNQRMTQTTETRRTYYQHQPCSNPLAGRVFVTEVVRTTQFIPANSTNYLDSILSLNNTNNNNNNIPVNYSQNACENTHVPTQFPTGQGVGVGFSASNTSNFMASRYSSGTNRHPSPPLDVEPLRMVFSSSTNSNNINNNPNQGHQEGSGSGSSNVNPNNNGWSQNEGSNTEPVTTKPTTSKVSKPRRKRSKKDGVCEVDHDEEVEYEEDGGEHTCPRCNIVLETISAFAKHMVEHCWQDQEQKNTIWEEEEVEEEEHGGVKRRKAYSSEGTPSSPGSSSERTITSEAPMNEKPELHGSHQSVEGKGQTLVEVEVKARYHVDDHLEMEEE